MTPWPPPPRPAPVASPPGSAPSPSPRRSRSTRRPRRSRPRAARSSASAPASPTSRRPTTSSRPPSRPAATPKNHRYTPAGGLPELKKAIAEKTAARQRVRRRAGQVLVTNGGKQAIYAAFATMLDPGDEVIVPGAVLDDVPRVDPAGRRRPRRGARRRDPGLQGHRRAARGRAHRADQGAAVRARRPTRPAPSTPPTRSAAIGRVGRGARPVGAHRRDLRAPGLRRRRDRLDAGRCAPSSPTTASSSTASPRPTR